MAKGKKEYLSLEDLLEQAVVKEEEQPYEVPSNWVWTRLNYVIELISGRDIKTSLCNENGIGIPYILGASNLQGDIFNVERWIEKPQVVSITGDILLSVKGTIGKVYLQVEDEINISRQIMALRSLSILDNRYLKKFIEHRSEQLRECGNGLIPGISREVLLQTKFPLPLLAEQQRIVERIESLFEKLDTAKELAQNALDSFENRKAAILHKAFTGELTAKWREENGEYENNIISSVLQYYSKNMPTKNVKQVVESQQGITVIEEIRYSTWYKCSIGAIAVVTNGSTPSRQQSEYWNGNIPWVSSGEVKNNIITNTKESITQSGYDNSSVKILPKGTVLIAMIGEGKTRGQSAVLDIEATTNQNVAAIDTSHQQVQPKFIWYWLQKQYENNREKGNGTGPQALNCQKVRELEFILPPLKEQEEIVKVLDSLFLKEQQAQELCDIIEKIDLMKKAILARAFRGELGTNNPEEESAIELLKEVLKEKL